MSKFLISNRVKTLTSLIKRSAANASKACQFFEFSQSESMYFIANWYSFPLGTNDSIPIIPHLNISINKESI
jgi:hypothetical protein